MNEKDNLSEEEKEIAKKNGIIILGKTGVGKTNLINAIFNEEKGKSVRTAKGVTTESCVYYYRLENNQYIALIDTPGLSDTGTLTNKYLDDIHLKGIKKIISEENIQLKGILFLVNFQSERFDADEQYTLIKYNSIFPVKNFWKKLIVIYTHYYADPDGDDVETIKSERDNSNSEIFDILMEKLKDVSEQIDYKQLKKYYFNLHFPIKNERQKENNMKKRKELEVELVELINSEFLFTQVEIMRFKNKLMKDKETGVQYLLDYEQVGYFDLNENNVPIKEHIQNLVKREISKNEKIPKASVKVEVLDCKIDSDNSIHYAQTFENFDNNSIKSKYVKLSNKVKGTIFGGVIGIVGGIAISAIGLAILPTIGIGLASFGIITGCGRLIGSYFD